MKEIGTSSLWVEKYRPQNFEDIICPSHIKNFLEQVRQDGDVSNLIFNGHAGTGKTTIARAIAKELKADTLYLNCSIDNSINDVRGKIQSFATSVSLFDSGKKIAILDEFERFRQEAQDALKALIEDTEKTCRYIFITNNIQKVIPPLLSRTQQFSFGIGDNEKKELVLSILKRCIEILEIENVEYDKKTLAEFVVKVFPDFRKTINELQKFSKSHGNINKNILNSDEKFLFDLIIELKGKKFNNVRKIATSIDTNTFYSQFYLNIDRFLQRECIPDIVVLLSEYAYRDAITIDREINVVSFFTELMKVAKWL